MLPRSRHLSLKYKFVVREIDGTHVAVAVGKDNEKFNGMIKLNSSGFFIFNLLKNGDVDLDEIVSKLVEKYDVSAENATEVVNAFLDPFKKNNLLEE